VKARTSCVPATRSRGSTSPARRSFPPSVAHGIVDPRVLLQLALLRPNAQQNNVHVAGPLAVHRGAFRRNGCTHNEVGDRLVDQCARPRLADYRNQVASLPNAAKGRIRYRVLKGMAPTAGARLDEKLQMIEPRGAHKTGKQGDYAPVYLGLYGRTQFWFPWSNRGRAIDSPRAGPATQPLRGLSGDA
jgi:hypothetical protein